MAGRRGRRLLAPAWIVLLGGGIALGAGCGGDNNGSSSPSQDGGEDGDASQGTDTGSDSMMVGGDSGMDSSITDTGTVDTSVQDTGTRDTSTADGSDGSAPLTINAITNVGDFAYIFDAVPDATGTHVYFTALDRAGNTGVFKVQVSAVPLTAVAVYTSGFVAPVGIAISTDGSTLYVADVGADTGNDLGGLFALSSAGGMAPTQLAGDVEPRGVTVVNGGGADTVFFTGRDKSSGLTGVFKVAAAGGSPTTLAEGPPFVDPSGVTVAASGDLFVTDTIASGNRQALVVKLPTGGAAAAFVSNLQVGYPTGIALVTGDQRVVLSGVDPSTGLDALTSYDTTSMAAAPFVTGAALSKLDNAAGLHRAAQANVFAFVDNPGNGTDAVYVIR